MTNYFSHDYSARNDIKLQKLVMEMGYEGLGFYWCVVEMLYEQGGRVELEQCTSIAFALHTDTEKINQLIDIVFEKDSKYFWSESVLKRLRVQKEISKVRKNAAKKKWENKAKKSSAPLDANGMQMQSKSNAIKEKEIKENNKDKSLGVNTKETPKSHGDPEIDEILKGFETHIGKLPSDKKPRQVAHNMRQLIHSFIKREGELFQELRGEPLTPSYVLPRLWEWYKGKDYATSTEKLETVKLKMVVWLDLIAKQLKQERGNYETAN